MRRTRVIASLALVAILAGCGWAQQPELIAAGSVAAPAGDGWVRYLANEGVLLSLPEATVLIDGLFGDGLPDYPAVEAATRDSLERGLGAFGAIDLVLVTHVHRDHFQARAVERHLIENPGAQLIAPRQVVDSLQILGSEYARIESRVHPLDAPPGEIVDLEVDGIPLRALGIAHPPSRNQPVEHVAYVVGREPSVAHLGDLGLGSAGVETLTAGRGVAVALVPYWILDGEESVARIEEALAPGCVIGFHVARGEGETVRAWLSERAPGVRLLTEPSTVSLAGCAGSAASAAGPGLDASRDDSPTLDGAIDDPEWEGAARPEARAHHQLAYRPGEHRAFLFGGSTPRDAGHHFFDDIWSWEEDGWRRGSPLPFPRSSHRVVYDAGRDKMVLFGGGHGNSFAADSAFWEWDGRAWSVAGVSPHGGMAEPGMCYDSTRSRTVLFGGWDAAGQFTGETWEWTGEELVRFAVPGPAARGGHAFVYDPKGRRCLLFGGRSDDGVLADTWAWDGTAWLELQASGPTARWLGAAATDHANERVILFSGWDGKEVLLPDTWAWDGESWERISNEGPPPRISSQLAFDGRGVLLFGGRTRTPDGFQDLNDTWELRGRMWFPIR